jgi:hypothetical protein
VNCHNPATAPGLPENVSDHPDVKQFAEDPLAKFRAQVQAEKDSTPEHSMSDKTTERLRQINYEDKIRKQGEEKFAYALTQIEPTPENLSALIARCSGAALLPRRKYKLLYWIQSRGFRLGHEIRLPEDITFLSELTPDELATSDVQFLATWRVDKIVPPKQDGPAPRYCALGRKCLKAVKGKAAVISGSSEWCSTLCRGRAKIIARKTLPALLPTVTDSPEPFLAPA